MSRNRPRPRDNGLGNNEEMELWTRICQDIHKSKEKFDQQASLSVQIKTLVDKITREGNSKSHPIAFAAVKHAYHLMRAWRYDV